MGPDPVVPRERARSRDRDRAAAQHHPGGRPGARRRVGVRRADDVSAARWRHRRRGRRRRVLRPALEPRGDCDRDASLRSCSRSSRPPTCRRPQAQAAISHFTAASRSRQRRAIRSAPIPGCPPARRRRRTPWPPRSAAPRRPRSAATSSRRSSASCSSTSASGRSPGMLSMFLPRDAPAAARRCRSARRLTLTDGAHRRAAITRRRGLDESPWLMFEKTLFTVWPSVVRITMTTIEMSTRIKCVLDHALTLFLRLLSLIEHTADAFADLRNPVDHDDVSDECCSPVNIEAISQPGARTQTLPESSVTGSRTRIRVPPTYSSSIAIVPLWAETIAAQIDRPRPAPPVLRDRELSPRAKRSKTTGRSGGGNARTGVRDRHHAGARR